MLDLPPVLNVRVFDKCCRSQSFSLRLHEAIDNPFSRQKEREEEKTREREREGQRNRETERERVSSQRDVLRFSYTCDNAIKL